ncbi:MAG: Photosystem I assembly protein Ycf3 [Bacteroidetes bacterium ADurb.Bin408]|nr:MAG: Photosystem I assembly protein Ycf3 [Bacteroidetes bacterium ADurb.Bin408]
MASKKVIPTTAVTRTFVSRKYYPLLLVVFTFLLYTNSLFNHYNLDDELVTRRHPLTSQGVSALATIFTTPYYSSKSVSYEYRPLVLASFAIEHTLFGESPFISHLINVLLYTLSVLVLYLLLKKWFGGSREELILMISLLFAAHPLHTEAVCSIKNRDEILSLLFALLAAYTSCFYIKKNTLPFLFLSAFLFVLALLSKSGVITFAFIIPFTLILFSGATFRQTVFITVLLSIITGFFAPFYNFSHKVMLAFTVFAAVLIAYGLMRLSKEHVKSVVEFIKSLWKNKEYADGLWQPERFSALAIVLAAVFLSATGMFYNFRLLIFISLVALVLLYFLCGFEAKQYFFSAFIFITALVAVNYKQAHILAFSLTLILFVHFFIEKKARTYTVISLLFLLVPWFLWARYEGLFWMVYITFILWLYSGEKSKKYAVILLGVFFISSPLVSYLRHQSLFNSGHFYSLLVLGLSLWLYHRFKSRSLSLLLLTAVIPMALAVKLSTMTGSYSVVIEKYLNPATAINIGADVLPAAGRRLDMVEMPLSVHDPLSLKTGTGLVALQHYIGQMLFPLNMGFYYGYKYIEPQSLFHLRPLMSLFIHLLLLALAIWFYRKEKLLLFGYIFYLSSLSVYSNIVAPVPGLIADRFALVPSLGFIIMLVAGLNLGIKEFLKQPKSKKIEKYVTISCVVILVLYSYRTFTRNTDWKDHLTLFSKDIEHLDKSAQAHNLLATHLNIAAGKEKNNGKALTMKEDAVFHYRKALEIYPDFFNASYDLGRTYYELNKYDSALCFFLKAGELNPGFFDTFLQIAYIYHQRGQTDSAELNYYKALELKSDVQNIYKNLSVIYFGNARYDKVIDINMAYQNQFPELKEPLINIARVYFVKAQYDSAAVYFGKILERDANDADAVMALIEIYTKTNNKQGVDKYVQYLNRLKNLKNE